MAQGRSGLPADPASIPKLSELAPDYFERRKRKHRAGFEDASRWRKHLAPYFEHLRPARVDAARIRAFIEAKLAQEANPATVRIYIALLSALFAALSRPLEMRAGAIANESWTGLCSRLSRLRPTPAAVLAGA